MIIAARFFLQFNTFLIHRTHSRVEPGGFCLLNIHNILLLVLVGLDGGTLQGEEKGGDQFRLSLSDQCRTQALGDHQGTGGSLGHHDVVDQRLSDQTINVGPVGMGIHGILEENNSTDLSADHVGNQFGITSEGSRGTGGSKDDGAVRLVRKDLLEHRHSRVGSGQTEFLEKILVGSDKLTHGLFHPVVGNQCEATHVRGREGRFEIRIKGVRGLLKTWGAPIFLKKITVLVEKEIKVEGGTLVHCISVVVLVLVVAVLVIGCVLDAQHILDWVDVLGDLSEHGRAVLLGLLDRLVENHGHGQLGARAGSVLRNFMVKLAQAINADLVIFVVVCWDMLW